MNDIDLEMLLGIADGTLTGDAREQALARIAASPELGEELAAQLAAMEGLASLSPATMTESERTTLRSNLIEQLHLEPMVTPAAVKRRHPWWQPVLGLASAAALLIAIVAVPSMFGGSADEGSSDVVALTSDSVARNDQDPAATTEAAPDGGSSPVATIVVPQIAESDVQEFFDSPPPDTDTVTTIAPETLTDEGQADSPEDGTDTASIEAAPLLSVLPDVIIDAADLEACITSLSDELPAGEYTPRAATLVNGEPIVHFGIEAVDGIVYSVSIAVNTCTLTVISP